MNDIQKLRYWTFKILPLVYDDSLSYYEVLAKVTAKTNELVENVNEIPDAITAGIKEALDSDTLATTLFGNFAKAIATNEGEATYTATTKNGGELIWLNGTLYEVVVPMTAGTSYIVGTNLNEVVLSDYLNHMKGYLSDNNEFYAERSTHDYDTGVYLYWKDNLYITTADIKVNDILYDGGVSQNLKEVTLGEEISSHYLEMHDADNNLQTQIDENENDIETKMTEEISRAKEAEQTLTKNLDNEINRATNRETNIDNRISNIVSQAGDDNTEIVDARKEASVLGETSYDTIGDAIRGQVTDLYNNSLISLTASGETTAFTDLNDVGLFGKVWSFSQQGSPRPEHCPENIINNMGFTVFTPMTKYIDANTGSLGAQFVVAHELPFMYYRTVAYTQSTGAATFGDWQPLRTNQGAHSYPTSTDLNDFTTDGTYSVYTNSVNGKPWYSYNGSDYNPDSDIGLLFVTHINHATFQYLANVDHPTNIFFRSYTQATQAWSDWTPLFTDMGAFSANAGENVSLNDCLGVNTGIAIPALNSDLPVSLTGVAINEVPYNKQTFAKLGYQFYIATDSNNIEHSFYRHVLGGNISPWRNMRNLREGFLDSDFVIVGENGAYQTINSAIDAGWTKIIILPGTYNERLLYFNTELTLIGLDREKTIIQSVGGLYGLETARFNAGTFKNLTFKSLKGDTILTDSQSGSYAVHVERQSGDVGDNNTISFINCNFESAYQAGLGVGLSSGQVMTLDNCNFLTTAESGTYGAYGGLGAFYVHNNANMTELTTVIANNCTFESTVRKTTICLYNYDATHPWKVRFNNCASRSATEGWGDAVYFRNGNFNTSQFTLDELSYGNSDSELNAN